MGVPVSNKSKGRPTASRPKLYVKRDPIAGDWVITSLEKPGQPLARFETHEAALETVGQFHQALKQMKSNPVASLIVLGLVGAAAHQQQNAAEAAPTPEGTINAPAL